MNTRKHVHEETLSASPERVFALLHTPSAIRAWWSAARAIVDPRAGGIWSAAWGSDEDDPDYITTATIQLFEPPTRLVMTDYRYYAKSGPLPFQPSFVTEFTVRPDAEGAILRVEQDGFPAQSEADSFFEGCKKGWIDTFAGIRRFLSSGAAQPALGKIGWQDLTVPDAVGVRDFYCAVAGWTFDDCDMGGYADYVMKASSGDAVGGVCHARGVNAGLPPQWLLYVTVPDLDRSIAECEKRGGKIVRAPREASGPGRTCVIQDPAGACLALVEGSA